MTSPQLDRKEAGFFLVISRPQRVSASFKEVITTQSQICFGLTLSSDKSLKPREVIRGDLGQKARPPQARKERDFLHPDVSPQKYVVQALPRPTEAFLPGFFETSPEVAPYQAGLHTRTTHSIETLAQPHIGKPLPYSDKKECQTDFLFLSRNHSPPKLKKLESTKAE